MKRKLDENDAPSVEVAETEKKDEPEKKEPGFADFGLDPRLLQAISTQKYKTPTIVQQKAIPLALEGQDIIARARTGSGKTAAYVLPVLESILKRKKQASTPSTTALFLVPTRELADQVTKVVESLTAFCSKEIQVVKLSDRVPDAVSKSLLSNSPDIVVATPARAWHNIKSAALLVDALTHLVIDEADLVLSYGTRLLFDDPHTWSGSTLPKETSCAIDLTRTQ